jgi:hypothetical protein
MHAASATPELTLQSGPITHLASDLSRARQKEQLYGIFVSGLCQCRYLAFDIVAPTGTNLTIIALPGTRLLNVCSQGHHAYHSNHRMLIKLRRDGCISLFAPMGTNQVNACQQALTKFPANRHISLCTEWVLLFQAVPTGLKTCILCTISIFGCENLPLPLSQKLCLTLPESVAE